MMTNSSIKYVHDTLKNAIGYNNGFNVEIGGNSISNLDICIAELRNMIKSPKRGRFKIGIFKKTYNPVN